MEVILGEDDRSALGNRADAVTAMSVPDPLPSLTTAELETLLSSLDPLLDGFGEGGSCLDDATAYLARLGIHTPKDGDVEESPLIHWIRNWKEAGGNRQTLRLMVSTILAERPQ